MPVSFLSFELMRQHLNITGSVSNLLNHLCGSDQMVYNGMRNVFVVSVRPVALACNLQRTTAKHLTRFFRSPHDQAVIFS